MKKIAFLLTIITVTAVVLFLTASTKKQMQIIHTANADEKGFAVLELFTSQGCSSCPPADELLGKYAMQSNKHIIPLAFHVDYWNRLGWIDSFSNSKYSQRQRDYASTFASQSVYTPQLVINGATEMIGSDADKIALAVDNTLKESPSVTLSVAAIGINNNTISFNYKATGTLTNMLIHAVLVQAKVFTNIKAGENRGLKLTNYNVVRDFVTTDKAAAEGKFLLQLPAGAGSAGFYIVLLAQDKTSGKIAGALQTGF